MTDIEIEVTSEIWRTLDYTFVVMYPLPDVAYVKGFRGTYTRKAREESISKFKAKGISRIEYERRKGDRCYTVTINL